MEAGQMLVNLRDNYDFGDIASEQHESPKNIPADKDLIGDLADLKFS